jgi:hypothetical protein
MPRASYIVSSFFWVTPGIKASPALRIGIVPPLELIGLRSAEGDG